MSEVDRLSEPGLFPAFPIGDKQRDKNASPGRPRPDPDHKQSDPHAGESSSPAEPRPPKSIIDEYA
jgi:hypothetical protein